MEIIKNNSKEDIHLLVVVVCLTVIMLSEKNELAFDLLEKITDGPSSEGSDLKNLFTLLLQEYGDLTGVHDQVKTPPKQSSSRKRETSGEFSVDSYQLYERIQKLEKELICRRK